MCSNYNKHRRKEPSEKKVSLKSYQMAGQTHIIKRREITIKFCFSTVSQYESYRAQRSRIMEQPVSINLTPQLSAWCSLGNLMHCWLFLCFFSPPLIWDKVLSLHLTQQIQV